MFAYDFFGLQLVAPQRPPDSAGIVWRACRDSRLAQVARLACRRVESHRAVGARKLRHRPDAALPRGSPLRRIPDVWRRPRPRRWRRVGTVDYRHPAREAADAGDGSRYLQGILRDRRQHARASDGQCAGGRRRRPPRLEGRRHAEDAARGRRIPTPSSAPTRWIMWGTRGQSMLYGRLRRQAARPTLLCWSTSTLDLLRLLAATSRPRPSSEGQRGEVAYVAGAGRVRGAGRRHAPWDAGPSAGSRVPESRGSVSISRMRTKSCSAAATVIHGWTALPGDQFLRARTIRVTPPSRSGPPDPACRTALVSSTSHARWSRSGRSFSNPVSPTLAPSRRPPRRFRPRTL